jgi:TM2 domain-containing membrane protein YozV
MAGEKIYKKPVSVLLMSAFILPGTGQFVNGQPVKGTIVMIGTVGSLIALVTHLILFFSKNFDMIWSSFNNTPEPAVAPSISIPLVIGLVMAFLFFYLYGMIDAYIVAQKKMQKDNQDTLSEKA